MVGSSNVRYSVISRILPLPCKRTIQNLLQQFKSQPGDFKKNAAALKLKINPNNVHENICFLLIDEMSLRKGLKYDSTTGSIWGYEDCGRKRTSKIVNSALCIMAVGIVKRWKFQLGFSLTGSSMKSEEITMHLSDAILAMESEDFKVVGVTSDQGSNFEKAFRLMGATPQVPKINLNGKKYILYRDPPHLLKNTRNFILKDDVLLPNHQRGSWKNVKTFFNIDN